MVLWVGLLTVLVVILCVMNLILLSRMENKVDQNEMDRLYYSLDRQLYLWTTGHEREVYVNGIPVTFEGTKISVAKVIRLILDEMGLEIKYQRERRVPSETSLVKKPKSKKEDK